MLRYGLRTLGFIIMFKLFTKGFIIGGILYGIWLLVIFLFEFNAENNY